MAKAPLTDCTGVTAGAKPLVSAPEGTAQEPAHCPAVAGGHEGGEAERNQIVDGRHQRPRAASGELEPRHAVEDVDRAATEIPRRVPEGPDEALGPRKAPDLGAREGRARRAIHVENPPLLGGQPEEVLGQRAGVAPDAATGLRPEPRVDRDAHLAANIIQFLSARGPSV